MVRGESFPACLSGSFLRRPRPACSREGPHTGRHQLYRGTADAAGASYSWEQLTFDTARDNIRPFVPCCHGAKPCVFWLRGTYRSHSDYQMDIYGLIDLAVAPVAKWPAPIANHKPAKNKHHEHPTNAITQ